MHDWKRGSLAKQQFAYSVASLLTAPFLLISILAADPPVILTSEKQELPFDTLLFIGLGEFLKLCWTLWLFPREDSLNPKTETLEMGNGSRGNEENRFVSRVGVMPAVSTKERKAFKPKNPLVSKSIEMFWGISGFIGSILICHLVLVLFGAPLIQDWKLTLQFSFILTSWLFFPLCLTLPPVSILPELIYISVWDEDRLIVGKWRFLVTCICTWMGAIAVPLDWDRPWQKWPIPCLLSATASQLLINFTIFFYFLPIVLNYKLGNFVFGKRVNKTKAI